MPENFRRFEVTDPFGRAWQAEFRWQQNAISIRHCDAVDCKYYITDGEEKREVVVALMHTDLLAVSARRGRPLTDAWCGRLASLHLQHMISTWEDMETSIATVTPADLDAHSKSIEEAENKERERLQYAH